MMTLRTKVKTLLSREFLLAATTVVILILKAFFGLSLPQKALQGIVLQVAAYILGQDALASADAYAA
jgi:predicted membrane channel-forming protein YqfA (hemolysin III family)